MSAPIHRFSATAGRVSRRGLTALLGLALALSVACGGGGDTSTPTAPAALAPAITTQPTSLSVNQGAPAAFAVVATGTAPLHYQWKLGTTNVGTDAATLTIPSAQPADAGAYTVTVTNTAGSITSSAATLIVTAASSTPANVNLALGKTATASSTESASYPAALAVDGQAATRWSSAFTDTEWLRVDLGAAQTFNRVVLRWEAAYGRGYVLEGSSDGATWTPFYTQASGTGGVEDLSFTSTTARYLRLRGTVRGTVYGYSLYELEVYRSVPCTLTATAGAHGTVSPAGAVSVVPGRSQTFTFT
ncbi:MAG: discoidin domain-containing protein, partial [Holophagaceae bacterium]